MRPVRRYAALFVVVAIVAGGVFWARSDEADWWAYVDDSERGPWPKFKFHWPEQLVISGVVGSFIAVPVVVTVFVARTVWSSLTRRRNR